MGKSDLSKGNLSKSDRTSLIKQRGIALWHVMLLVIIAVTLALCGKRGTVPFFQTEAPIIGKLDSNLLPAIPGFSSRRSGQSQQHSAQPRPTDYEPSDIQPPRVRVSRESPVNEYHSESLMLARPVRHTTTAAKKSPKTSQYDRQYPANLTTGYYTVQVFSGYNSKSAYDLQKALQRDGYRSYIHTEETRQGILFKVRIGEYTNRSDAFAMKSKIRRSYPQKMGKSFVLLRAGQ